MFKYGLVLLLTIVLFGCAHVQTSEEQALCILHGICPSVNELK